MMKATCRGCGKTFETERLDSIFCDGACKARWWRLMGQTGQHAKLEHLTSKHCEHCGNIFWFNDYADRKGKRVPTYCRDACRVAAHRERTKAKWTHEQTAERDKTSREAAQKKAREQAKRSQPPPPPPPPNTGDFRDKLKAPSHWDTQTAFTWLGMPWESTEAQCTKRWRDLNKAHHPDANGGKIWVHLPYVNAAYDYLKRHIWKRR
jgi:hypothetical protein